MAFLSLPPSIKRTTNANMAARLRLSKELKEISRDKDASLVLAPRDDNLFTWTCALTGPSDTPYAGGRFHLLLRVPDTYPLAAPTVTFRTRIFHPNVHFKTGEVCLDILKTQWSPAWTLQSVCRAVAALMAHAEPDSPLNCDAGNLLRAGDVRGYNSIARMYTVECATE